ncbi:MAG TPA: hypothetical protein PKA95_05105 [Thermomicrobiales bacterium]|nr:hypothetical protein [Thermomicrobiales bacterium]
MQAQDILDRARDTLTVKRVFGEPIHEGDVTLVPVANVSGGAGAGSGPDDQGGSGGGFGVHAKGIGVYEIRNGAATFKPAIDVNRVIMGGQLIAIVAIIVIGGIIRARMKATR